MRPLLAVMLLCASVQALAREQFPGQYAQADPGLRDWYRGQLVPDGPGKGSSCCSDADGVTAQEDIRDGSYWAAFTITVSVTGEQIDVPMMQVPKEVVLQGPFPARVGNAVVWWWAEWDDSRTGVIKRGPDGKLLVHIRCYKPGSGV